jgi:diguanylate cyclase (GGDEF)-like protein
MSYGGAPAILVALNDISQRKEMEAELFSQATTDELTGISNRRHFFMQAERELGRAQRFGRPLSAMMLDLDHFKKINDTHGHAVGDGVLQTFVKRALESLRQSDVIGRLGGEEFAVIMPETAHAAAEAAAERLRAHVAEKPLIADREAVQATVSVGVATFHTQDTSIDKLLHRADQALYRAKNNGRNRVEIAE